MMRLLALLTLAVAFFGNAPAAHAYRLNSEDGRLRGWKDEVLRVNLNLADCPAELDMRKLVGEAMAVWNSVPDIRVKLELGSDSTTKASAARSGEAKDSPVIICDRDFRANTNMDGNTVPGVGGIAVELSSNRIVYGYILLNVLDGATASLEGLDENRVRIVLAHELGHVLGLGHSDDPRALMFPNITRLLRAELSSDDVAGVMALYGPESQVEEGGGIACAQVAPIGPSAGSGSGGGPALASFVLFLLTCAAGTRLLRRA